MRIPRSIPFVLAAWLAAAGCATTRPVPTSAPPPARLTHGVAVGEVTASSAVFWGRCDRATALHVRTASGLRGSTEVDDNGDFAGAIRLDGLSPNRRVVYAMWCGEEDTPPARAERVESGVFVTAPTADDTATPVRIAWGGDLGGQNVCRSADEGYAIFARIRETRPSLFIALGDLVYADDACKPQSWYGYTQVEGPPPAAAEVEAFRRHWRYNRADLAFQELLRSTSILSVWDDHEIVNDAGPAHDESKEAPGVHRLPPARTAFVDWQPLERDAGFHRSLRWGRHAEIFVLDTRSQRDANFADDSGASPKTMLGGAQRDWLARAVAGSDATWKLVVSSVPISIPTGGPIRGYDGWANFDGEKGFERELLGLLQGWRDAGVRNLVFLTTDVHFATGLRYRPFPEFTFLEFVSGPLNAGMFPKQELDETLRPERLFLYGPPDPMNVRGLEEARRYFNFGELDIDASGALRARIVNGDGAVVYERRFEPQP